MYISACEPGQPTFSGRSTATLMLDIRASFKPCSWLVGLVEFSYLKPVDFINESLGTTQIDFPHQFGSSDVLFRLFQRGEREA